MPNYVLKNIEYVCMQKEDVTKYLNEEQQKALYAIVNHVHACRTNDGLPPLRLAIKDLRETADGTVG